MLIEDGSCSFAGEAKRADGSPLLLYTYNCITSPSELWAVRTETLLKMLCLVTVLPFVCSPSVRQHGWRSSAAHLLQSGGAQRHRVWGGLINAFPGPEPKSNPLIKMSKPGYYSYSATSLGTLCWNPLTIMAHSQHLGVSLGGVDSFSVPVTQVGRMNPYGV